MPAWIQEYETKLRVLKLSNRQTLLEIRRLWKELKPEHKDDNEFAFLDSEEDESEKDGEDGEK